MNDRYLFRGKRIDNGAWETGSLVIERQRCHDESTFITDKMTGYHTPVYPQTVGQCTGLKDCNWKLIFEGDIFKTHAGCASCIAVVEWSDDGGFLGFSTENERRIVYVGREPAVEVIGNIHDDDSEVAP